MWEGFRLDVEVTFQSQDAKNAVIPGRWWRYFASPGDRGRRFETRVNEILSAAKGETQQLSPDGVRVVGNR